MNKRLVWNFEITPNGSFQQPPHHEDTHNGMHWESRFFWSGDEVIPLGGLDEHFLNLSRYTVKHRQDFYFLLPDVNYNLKQRHEKLSYKPIIKQSPFAIAYGKKIKLEEQTPSFQSPGGPMIDPHALILRIQHEALSVCVDKEALMYQFPSAPNTKLELARLVINTQVFFSVSIESPALTWVETFAQHLVPAQTPCDYVTFLKRLTAS
jgi:hypothetical protein